MAKVTASKENTAKIGVNTSTRLAIVGIGLVGKRHADAINQLSQTKLSAIVDPNLEGNNYLYTCASRDEKQTC